MGRGRALSLLLWGLAFGLAIAVPTGDQRRLSIDLWLAGVTAWLGIGLAARALGAVPVGRPGLRLPIELPIAGPLVLRRRWPFLVPARPPEPPTPRSLLALEGSVHASVDNPRAFAHRLRPRLRRVAAHRLALNRGIDLGRDPERAGAVLGDVAWLVGDGPPERAPTLGELARLLDRLEAADGRPPDGGRDR